MYNIFTENCFGSTNFLKLLDGLVSGDEQRKKEQIWAVIRAIYSRSSRLTVSRENGRSCVI
jgi:hypothetical protein